MAVSRCGKKPIVENTADFQPQLVVFAAEPRGAFLDRSVSAWRTRQYVFPKFSNANWRFSVESTSDGASGVDRVGPTSSPPLELRWEQLCMDIIPRHVRL